MSSLRQKSSFGWKPSTKTYIHTHIFYTTKILPKCNARLIRVPQSDMVTKNMTRPRLAKPLFAECVWEMCFKKVGHWVKKLTVDDYNLTSSVKPSSVCIYLYADAQDLEGTSNKFREILLQGFGFPYGFVLAITLQVRNSRKGKEAQLLPKQNVTGFCARACLRVRSSLARRSSSPNQEACDLQLSPFSYRAVANSKFKKPRTAPISGTHNTHGI